MHQTCYVSGTGWLCFRIGQHSIPVFKLNDAQTREWNDAEKFVANKQETVHPVVAADGLGAMLAAFMADNNLLYAQPDTDAVPVTLRCHSDSGQEYNLPLNKKVIATLNDSGSLSAATAFLHFDCKMPLHVCSIVIEWLAFHGFITDKFIDVYDFQEKFSRVVIIPQDYIS